MIRYFRFEEDFVEDNIRCIPMIARFKLDACCIKLKLKTWSQLSEQERIAVSTLPCITAEEIMKYRQYLEELILNQTGSMPQYLEVDKNPSWANKNEIPELLKEQLSKLGFSMKLAAWQGLNDLQRFVLVKLSAPGHENKNFPFAMHEFGLI